MPVRLIRRTYTTPQLMALFDAWWWSQHIPDDDTDGDQRQRIEGHTMTPADLAALFR